jgi:hypothetical protein
MPPSLTYKKSRPPKVGQVRCLQTLAPEQNWSKMLVVHAGGANTLVKAVMQEIHVTAVHKRLHHSML